MIHLVSSLLKQLPERWQVAGVGEEILPRNFLTLMPGTGVPATRCVGESGAISSGCAASRRTTQ
jgi:hypothetical protein